MSVVNEVSNLKRKGGLDKGKKVALENVEIFDKLTTGAYTLVKILERDKITKNDDKGRPLDGTIDIGLAMKGLVCEIYKATNVAHLSVDIQFVEESMAVDAASGATTSS